MLALFRAADNRELPSLEGSASLSLSMPVKNFGAVKGSHTLRFVRLFINQPRRAIVALTLFARQRRYNSVLEPFSDNHFTRCR